MKNWCILKCMIFLSLSVLIVPGFLVSGCTVKENRLVPSGKTVIVKQGTTFCEQNKGDSVCTD